MKVGEISPFVGFVEDVLLSRSKSFFKMELYHVFHSARLDSLEHSASKSIHVLRYLKRSTIREII